VADDTDDTDDRALTDDRAAGDDPPDAVEGTDGIDGTDSRDDDAARPFGRVVQLQRPRPRRRRVGGRSGGAAADPTRPAGRWAGAVAAGEHEPGEADQGLDPGPAGAGAKAGPRRRAGGRRHTGEVFDDVASPVGGETGAASGEPPAPAGSGVVALTTARGRRGRGEAHDAGSAPTGGEGAPAAEAALPELHPRMRRRRIAVRRSEGLRRLRRLTWGLAGLALLVDGLALAHTGFADVDRFAVAGSPHVPAAAVRHASGIHAGDALLTLDEAGAERRIEELPWVAEADVVRQWPDTVRIVVTERQPAAVLQVSEDPAAPLALVDATGRVLEIGAHPEGLIAVTQVPPELGEGDLVPSEARDAVRIAVASSQRMPGTIVSLTVGLEATLGSGGVVLFGSVDDLDSKLMALSTVLAGVDLECLDSLDLAVPDHPALRRSC
jgi:cell division protein FtsQ